MSNERQDKRLEPAFKFLNELETFISNQPSVEDLGLSLEWMRDLNAHYVRWAQLFGELSGYYARLMHYAISQIPDEEYKKIKASSTITDLYVKGKYPGFTTIYEKMQVMGKVLQEVSQNTRTMMASQRQQVEFDGNAKVRQQ